MIAPAQRPGRAEFRQLARPRVQAFALPSNDGAGRDMNIIISAFTVRALPQGYAAVAFSTLNRVCMAVLYGRTPGA